MQKTPCSVVIGIETTERVDHGECAGGDRAFLISPEPPRERLAPTASVMLRRGWPIYLSDPHCDELGFDGT